MSLRTLIIEDEIDAQELLSGILKELCPYVEIKAVVSNIHDARESLTQSKFDLTFLDVQLGDELTTQLLDTHRQAMGQIIFTTAYERFAIPAIKASALDYILKPLNPLEVQAAVEKALIALHGNDSAEYRKDVIIELPSVNGVKNVSAKDIIRVEAQRMYSVIYLENGEAILTSKPLKEWESILVKTIFFRPHQSHLIQIGYVKGFSSTSKKIIVLKDGSEVPLARRRKEEFLLRLGF